jgi:hypothetical protein
VLGRATVPGVTVRVASRVAPLDRHSSQDGLGKPALGTRALEDEGTRMRELGMRN